MSALELIFDYFEDHVRAAAAIQERRPLALGVLCFLLGGLAVFVAQGLTQRLYLLSFSWSSLMLALGWKVAAGFLLTAILHVLLDFTGNKGSAASLFVLLGMASLVWGLTVPLILLARLLLSSSSWLTGAIFMGVGFLSLSLKARSLQDNYHVSTGKAWVMLSLPYIAFIAAAVLAFFLAVAGLMFELVKAFH
ncbi:MAG: hypothetical protein HY077_10525 [Elusimicrobia bacterium]|nr:hypothetical protein [Elusimicrobiota bacterium]